VQKDKSRPGKSYDQQCCFGNKDECVMLSVQDINDHMVKYVKILQAWRSKNYAFEFVDCINHDSE